MDQRCDVVAHGAEGARVWIDILEADEGRLITLAIVSGARR